MSFSVLLLRRAGPAFAVAMLGLVALGGPARAQTFGTDQNSCDRGALSQILSTSKGNLLGSAAGAALGGLLGNQFGKGGGNTVMTIVGVVGGALAGGYVGRSMDPTDQACVGQTLEHTPTNQTVAWHNPDNDSSYWVTPTGTYQAPNGQQCRDYVTNAVINGQRQQTQGVACRDQNGRWGPVNAAYAPQQQSPQAPPPPAAYAPPQQAPQAPPPPGAISSDTVLQVQQRLHDLGFYVRDNIDGVWGRNTMAAVSNFQRSKGFNPTGQLDPQTLQALGLTSNGPSNAQAAGPAPTQ
jgi:surface antigen